MTMGVQGKNGVRNHDLNECQEIIDVFHRYGHKELDTARMYAEGTTEEVCVWHYFMNGIDCDNPRANSTYPSWI